MSHTGLGEEICPWEPLDIMHRICLGVMLIILGISGVAANGWLTSTFLMSPLLTIRTHLLLLNLTLACLGRGLLAGFPFAATSTLSGRWLFGAACCQFFAFLRHFFGMSQVATLTLLAVERVIVVRQLYSENYLSLQLYIIGIISCWFAAAVWAMPPLLGWGRYTCDPTALSCSLDWTSRPSHSNFGYNISLLIIGGVLAAMVTCICVWCSVSAEGKFTTSSSEIDMNRASQRYLTKTVGVLVPALYLMWLPETLLTLWTITRLPIQTALIVLAPISSEASAMVPIVTCLACDFNMRKALLGLVGRISVTQPRGKTIQLKDIK